MAFYSAQSNLLQGLQEIVASCHRICRDFQ